MSIIDDPIPQKPSKPDDDNPPEFDPPDMGVVDSDLKSLSDSYGSRCVPKSTNWNDAPTSEVFSTFSLSTDGVVNGNSLSLKGDSSLSFSIKDKSYVQLTITLKSRILRNGWAGFPYDESFVLSLESGDSFSAGTIAGLDIGTSTYNNLSIIKNGIEQISLSEIDGLNTTYHYNQIEITWNKSVWCIPAADPPPFIDDDPNDDLLPPIGTDLSGGFDDDDDDDEDDVEGISDNTLWMILGIIVIFLGINFLMNDDTSSEGCD
tara:strand:+ start:816 stop:1601 length:786 start_codon:yes stop_codon:yes gene_type:complete